MQTDRYAIMTKRNAEAPTTVVAFDNSLECATTLAEGFHARNHTIKTWVFDEARGRMATDRDGTPHIWGAK